MLPSKHLQWFKMMNAGAAWHLAGKTAVYTFKGRMCRRFGRTDGFDLQVIEFACWGPGGPDRGQDCNAKTRKVGEPVCPKCGGTGVFDRKRVWLLRWRIGEALFHEPVTLEKDHFLYLELLRNPPEPREKIIGYVKHEPVSQLAAYRAYMRLLLRYEPAEWVKQQMNRLRNLRDTHCRRVAWNIRRLRDVFRIAQPDTDVPF